MFTEIAETVEQSRLCDIQADQPVRIGRWEHQVAVSAIDVHEQFVVKITDTAFEHLDPFGRTELEKLLDQGDTVRRLKRPVYFRWIFRDPPGIQKAPKPFFRKNKIHTVSDKAFPDIMYIIPQYRNQIVAVWKFRINVLLVEIIRNTVGQTREHLKTVVLINFCPEVMEISKLGREIVHGNTEGRGLLQILVINLMKELQAFLCLKQDAGTHVFGKKKCVSGCQNKIRKEQKLI